MAEEDTQHQNVAKERMATRDKLLDEYERGLGLPQYSSTFDRADEIDECLNYGRDELEKLTPEQCMEEAIMLKSFALHIQRAKNREVARITWAEGQLRSIVTPKICNYRGGSFNQIFDMAALDDQYTADIMKIRDFAQQRSDRLDFLSNTLKDKAEDLKELSRTKRARGNG
jgi:hypothetical protein